MSKDGSKDSSQLSGWQLAQNRDCFCDFGRKLVNLRLPGNTQWCSATDGRTRQHRVMDDSLLPVTSLRENLTQTHLDFSYFRTTEPKLTPALRKMSLTDLQHTIWVGNLFHKQTIIYWVKKHTNYFKKYNRFCQIAFYSVL